MSDPGSMFSDAGFQLPGKKAGAPADSVNEGVSLFRDAGFQLNAAPEKKSSGQFSDEIPIYAPGTPEYEAAIKKYGVNNPENADTLENRMARLKKSVDPATVLPAAARVVWEETKNAAYSGAQTYQSGVSDIGHSMTASGIGKAGLGALQMAGSPITGAIQALVGQPVTALTGNPAIGQDVSNAAGFLLPMKGAPAVVKATNENRAVSALVKTIGPENVPAAVARLQSNPRLSLMDVSDPVRTVVQGLIDPAQPQAQNIITQAVKQRAATLPEATNSAFTRAMGPAPDVPVMLSGLKQHISDVGKTQIEPALQNAKAVDVTPVLKAIDDEIGADPVGKASLRALKEGKDTYFPISDYQSRLFQLRQQLSSGVGDQKAKQFLDATGEQGAHNIQAGLRAEAQNLLNSATGSDRNLGGKLMDMRGKLVDAIDNAAGGKYKPALKAYRDANQVDEAFEAGFDTLKNRSGRAGLEDRPEMFDQWMKNATPAEVVARRLGTRLDIDQKIRSVKNQALAGQNITAIEYNRDKLTSLFGIVEAQRLIRTMDDAAAEAQTNAKILQGSKTAETLAGQKALEVRKVGGGNLLNWMAGPAAEIAGEYLLGPGGAGLGAGAFGATKALQLGTQSALRSLDRSRNISFARAASATFGPKRQETISALLSHPDVVRALKKPGNALTTP